MFLFDPATKPTDSAMKNWVNRVKWLKHRSPTGALKFFTYGELMLWLILFTFTKPNRWRWALFVLCGWGKGIEHGHSVGVKGIS
jgi:hypothetical protein